MNNPAEHEGLLSPQPDDVAGHIVALLKTLRFGSIEIVVHDGRIVQIDKHEKFRLKGTHATH